MDFSPKEIVIEEIKAQPASLLNNIWHSRLPEIHWSNIVRNTCNVCYVFKYKEALIGVAIWSSPVSRALLKQYGKDRILELRRLALSDVCPRNTASHVIARMEKLIVKKFENICKLISYQDTATHLGTIYKASNWTKVITTKGHNWTTPARPRKKTDSTSNKIRWEKNI